MKKITTTFLLIISILGGLFTLSSCEKKITKNDEAVEEMITEDYIQFYWSDLPTGKTDYMYIKYFLGIYDNLYVATFYDYNLPGRPHTDIVGGVSFVYSESGTRTVVWKNHKFFELNEAYEKGLFSLEQIETIHKEYLRYQYSNELIEILLDDYFNFYYLNNTDAEKYGIWLMNFIGKYDEKYACVIHDGNTNYVDYKNVHYDGQYDKEKIGELEFVYPSTSRISIWDDHQYYELKDAYQDGIISAEELLEIYTQYNRLVWKYPKY